MAANTDTFSVRLPEELKSEVDRFAALTKRSRSFVIKEAVASYMEEQRAYLEALDEAIAEADKGIFVSGEAVDAWLRSWGTDNVLPTPEPDIFPDGKK